MGDVKETVPDTVNVQHSPDDSTQTEVVIVNDIPESHFRKHLDYRSEYADIASRLTAAHFTEDDVAYALGISKTKVRDWKNKFPGFKQACEDGRRESKKRLVAQGIKQAMGYNTIEKNVKQTLDANGKILKQEVSEFHKAMPGNERMLVFMLMNMDRQLKDQEWENINKVEVDESKNIKITIDGKAAREQIKKLSGELLDEQNGVCQNSVGPVGIA